MKVQQPDPQKQIIDQQEVMLTPIPSSTEVEKTGLL